MSTLDARTDDGAGDDVAADPAETPHPAEQRTTTVEVRATGKVRDALPSHSMSFTFEGETLRAFLDAFFAEYDVADLLMAETESEATARGWANPPDPDDLPGTWAKNPEGEQTRTYARVCVNGQFNQHLDGLDTELTDEDRVALINPFVFCV
jgi:molybdopterin converting factor small subunit